MTPEQRVLAYIRDYVLAWAGQNEDADDLLSTWRSALEQLERQHFAHDAHHERPVSFSSPCPHDADREEIVDTQIQPDSARVVSTMGRYSFFEWHLQPSDDSWRIVRLRSHLDHPDDFVVRDKALARLDEVLDLPLREPDEPPSPWLFALEVETSAPQTVEPMGRLQLPSGIILVQDFGYGDYAFLPLAHRVHPGAYPVEISRIGQTNAGVRVCFQSPDTVVEWRAAHALGGDWVTGVDAGNVAIADASAYSRLTVGKKADVYDAAVVHASRPAASLVSLSTDDDGFICDSGYGDGGYPRYWGVDATGTPAVLLIDFRVK